MANIKVIDSARGMVIQTPFMPNNIGKMIIPATTKMNPLPMEIDIDALEYSID